MSFISVTLLLDAVTIGMLKIAMKQPMGTTIGVMPSPSDSINGGMLHVETAANNSVKELCKRIHNWLSD